MMGIPLVCYCLAVPKPVIAFCMLLSTVRDAALLMLAVVGLCRFPPDGADAGHQHQQPGEVKTQLPAVEYGQLLAAGWWSSGGC
jgi:RING-H2 zinc finger protein RHA1